jgi:hypothetical protein
MLSEHASPQTRLQAARDVLDRLDGVATRRTEAMEPTDMEPILRLAGILQILSDPVVKK